MRLSNKGKIPRYNFIGTFFIMLVGVGVFAFFVEQKKLNLLGNEGYLLIIVPVLLYILNFLNGRQVFEYDSDGEAVHFRNRSVAPHFSSYLSDEFPKYKLIKFDVVTVLFVKRLYITISSKNNGTTLLKYDISYLTSKEINDLKMSLNKIVKNNQENRH